MPDRCKGSDISWALPFLLIAAFSQCVNDDAADALRAAKEATRYAKRAAECPACVCRCTSEPR